MSLRSLVTVVSILATGARAHMIMASPVPYSIDKLDNSPITADQYPCKSNIGYTVSTMNQMAIGTKQSLTFKGSAVHGGGSCQLSVTTDTTPTKDSVFKVIKSIEGGCPGINGPESFEFELPDSIPNGKATFAWTWFAKLSGGPEMYMNCAPIEVSGGASDKSKFEALPNMLVANLGSTSCKSQTSKALKFPNPGSVVQAGTDSADVVDPTGDCGSSGSTPPNPSEPSGSAGVEPPAAPTSAAPSSVAPTSPPSGQYTASAAPIVPSAAPVISSASPITPPKASGTRTTLVTVTAKPKPKPTVPGSGVPIGTGSPAVPTTTPSPSNPSSGGASSGTCTTNGAVVCNGGTQFGLCNNGKVQWQAVAAGTTCTNGIISKRGSNGRIARPRFNSPRFALGN